MTIPSPTGQEAPDTVLIIEDEATERMLSRVHLERAGYRVIEAEDGPDGFALAREHKPDLIILDVHLPTTNGFDLCRKIRADRILSQTPVLISTGLEEPESVAVGFEAGASDFLTKPTIWALLSYRVKFLLRSARAERELADATKIARASAIALAENERHYRDLFDYAPVMMHRIDERYRIQDVNRAWLAKTGFSRDEIIGTEFIDFVDEDTRTRFLEKARRKFIETGSLADETVYIRRKDGTIIDTLMTSTGEFDNEHRLLGAHAVLLDVTERNRAERNMREAQESAEAASRAKSVFLATMSHEIRTPLNGIIGMIDLLEHTEINKDQAGMIGTVRDSAYSLLNIIGDILDFSKIEAGELTTEQIGMSVPNVVEGAVETLAPLARDKNIELNVYTDPTIPDSVFGDPVRIRQILFNLVGNAIKFSERKDGGSAEVNVRADLASLNADGQSVVRFTVSDTGIGISGEHKARLFTPFFQAENSTVRRFGGTGLGLSICKNLVGLMGGRIRVESQLGEGATFTFELPMKATTKTSNRKPDRLKDVRILLVMPPPSFRRAVEKYLTHEGAQVVVAHSFAAAQTLLVAARHKGWPYNLAIFAHTQPQTVEKENALIAALGKDPAAANMGVVLLSEDRRNRTRPVLPHATLVQKRPLSQSALLWAVLNSIGQPQEDAVPTHAPEAGPTPRTVSKPARGLILVAEDNAINQMVIQRQLQQFGFIPDIASDGAEALKAYEQGNFKLLLTDCHMPEMDGFELTEAIRTKERDTGQRLPIIAITANAQRGEADHCFAIGMDDFLTKPVELKKIGAMLDKWLPKDIAVAAANEPAPARIPTPTAPMPEPATPAAPADKNGAHEPGNPIDVAMLSRLLGTDDDSYLHEMIAVYWDTMRETPTELTTLVTAHDASKLRDAAHAAKGASASVGAMPVSSLLEKLQFAARDADWERINSLMPQIENAFSDLEQFIGTLKAA